MEQAMKSDSQILSLSPAALDARARRAAASAGYLARKSRWRADSFDNQGEFMLVDATTNIVVAGYQFDMDAEEIIAWCKDD
jgi:hypothetical protein